MGFSLTFQDTSFLLLVPAVGANVGSICAVKVSLALGCSVWAGLDATEGNGTSNHLSELVFLPQAAAEAGSGGKRTKEA